jgi:hypothetical protein
VNLLFYVPAYNIRMMDFFLIFLVSLTYSNSDTTRGYCVSLRVLSVLGKTRSSDPKIGPFEIHLLRWNIEKISAILIQKL